MNFKGIVLNMIFIMIQSTINIENGY